MHTARIIAFMLFTAAAIITTFSKNVPVALISAGLAVELVPSVF